MEKSMSVWKVVGRPKTADGQDGGLRATLNLLPMDAVEAQAIDAFIDAANVGDQTMYEYVSAQINEVMYCGWVWLPKDSGETA